MRRSLRAKTGLQPCEIRARRGRERAVWWLAAVMCLAASGFPRASHAQATFMGLGDLPGGDFYSQASDVSADGTVVVGSSRSAAVPSSEAFRWTSAGGMVGLGALPGDTLGSSAGGVSADGSVVVGRSADEAFRWTEAGGMEGIGDFPGGDFRSEANDVSADGSVVVGSGMPESYDFAAFRWTAEGGMVALGPLPGSFESGYAFAVSADGSVAVGSAMDPFFKNVAFRWTAAGGMVPLSDLRSDARGVSADGSVVVGNVRSFDREAFRWTEADGIVRLGDLPGGDFFSVASDVSADGSVVTGWGRTASGDEAFIWDADNGMRNLRDLLAELGAGVDGWQLRSVSAISADGRTIVGGGLNPSGQTEAWIALLPPPAPECGDGGDNDGDGLIDLADPGCVDSNDASEHAPSLVCDDGVDNDGDGFADAPADPGCVSPTDASEQEPSLVCDDGIDNDGDGFVDYPADAGCSDPADESESVEPGFTGLGDLPGGSFSSNAYGVSGDGRVVVGSSDSATGQTAFRWTEAGGLQGLDLPASEARGASADGSAIAGTSRDRAFRWDQGRVTALLAPPPFGGDPVGSWAYAVSADGSTVAGEGEPYFGSDYTYPIAWSGDTVGTPLRAYSIPPNRAVAVSADGAVITGHARNSEGDLQAFRYAAGVFQFLPTSTWYSSGNGVSADGSVVVGSTLFFGIGNRAFRWTEAGGAEILVRLDGEEVLSGASGVSADGSTIVGMMEGAPMIWTEDTGMVNLRERLVQLGLESPFAGWTQTEARAISANGLVIVGDGVNPSGQTEAWIAVLPEPPAPQCGDGLDNDDDGFADSDDPGCDNAADLDEKSPTLSCDDGADNDGDGKTDYRAAGDGDPGCGGSVWGIESPRCQDGLDNDGDGFIDFDGGDSLDIDPRDGLIDAQFNPATPLVGAADLQCLGRPYRRSEVPCGLGAELALVMPLLGLAARRRRRAN